MTDERAARLLSPLRQDPEGPSRIDVAEAMTEGRRRRVLHRWSGSVALVALTSVTAGGGTFAFSALRTETPLPAPSPVVSVSPSAVAAAPARPAGGCEVTRLPTAGVKKAVVTAGDASGHHLAGRLYRTTDNLIVWKDGKILHRLRMPGDDARFTGINSSGVAAGSSFLTFDQQQAYVYRNGRLTELDGKYTSAAAINDAGIIVGGIGETMTPVPAMWESATAKVTKLPLPAGYIRGSASGVADDGTVIGEIFKNDRDIGTSYLWLPDGTGKAMKPPTVDGRKADTFWAESITDGWVAGRAVFDDAKDGSRSFTSMRYRIADAKYQELHITVIPAFIAANGWVAGVTNRPVIVAGSEVVELPFYGKLREYDVRSISADGRVISGYSFDSIGDQVGNEPILWTCG